MTWTEHDQESLSSELACGGISRVHTGRILRSWYRTGGEIDAETRLKTGPRLVAFLRQNVKEIASHPLASVSSDDGTEKLVIAYPDGATVESVLIPAYRSNRAMACVSSQVGCAMGCDFCASTLAGVQRDLTFGEIVEQFVHLNRIARERDRRITSLVFMGLGEPMLNLDNVIAAVKRIAHPDMGGVGWRNITVSTVGVVPGIDALADADLNVHLAISLHAADDQTRSRIVPIARKYGIGEILSAAQRFYDRTGRIITIQWCMLDGINDGEDQADKLATLLTQRGMLRIARVNVIPFNPIGASLRGITYRRPAPMRVKLFIERLQLAHVVTHQRDTRGDDVSAACGQLRRVTPVK